MLIAGSLGWADLSLADAWSSLTYTSNYVVGSLKHIVAHTWSLSTEEQFYLVWPVAFLAAGRRRAEIALVMLMLLAEVSSRVLTRWLGYDIPTFFNTPIGVGCMLALLRNRIGGSEFYREWTRAPVGAFALFAIIGVNYADLRASGILRAALPFVDNVAIAVWIDWLTQNSDSAFSRMLNTRALIVVGLGSYSLYLWQQPFLHLRYSHPALLLQGPWKMLSNPLLRVILIAMCGCCSYLLVERPFLRLRTYLERRFFAIRPLHERLVVAEPPEANSAVSREAGS
jgi:peptidoglycan/LPS O-acetylase OafA/YrhL